MTTITLPYPHLGFISFNKNALTPPDYYYYYYYHTPRLHFTYSFQTRTRKIATVRASSGTVINKEHEFKPVFEEYLKAMETVKSRREKRKTLKDVDLSGVEDEISVKEDEGKKLGVRKKVDPEGVRRNAYKDEFQEKRFNMKRVGVDLNKDDVVNKWTRKEPGSGSKEAQLDIKLQEQSFNMKRVMPGSKEVEVVKKWTRKEPGTGYKEAQLDIKFQEQNFNMKRVMPGSKEDEDEGMRKWTRKEPGSGYKAQMDSKFEEQSFNMKRAMPDLKKDEGRKKWTRKEQDFKDASVDTKFQEQGFRVSPVKKSIRKSEHGSYGDMEIERAAFKSLEEFPDVCDQPRVSRVDMEERIQKLAKCLNGASIDTPEWNFSKMMRSAKIRFADFSIIRLIQILGNYGNWRQVLQVIEWMQARERFKSNRIRNIYTAALDALGKARRPVEALNMFNTMQQQMASYPDLVAYHCIAVTLGQAGHMRELFHVIDTMRSPPKKKLATGVLQKWDPRLEPDIIVYNAVLNACVRQKNLEGAFWVLQQLKQQGQQPNSITYGLVMEVMLACEKYNLVHEFFKKMRKSFIPNSLTYKVLVNTLWKEGKVDEAILTVKEMEKRGIIGSAALYYDLARCLCSAGRCEEAIVQIEKVCKVANKPLVVTYTGLIQASLDSGKIESGIYIFKHMHKFCSPNLVTYNIMLKGYLDHHMFEEAKQLFYKLLENGNHVTSKVDSKHVVLPDIHTFNLMLDACLVNKKWDDLEFVYTKMLQHGYYFNAKRHSHMILEACKAGKVNLLETTWKHLMEGDQIPPPPLVQEMFCMKLEQDDYAAAFSCLKCLPSTESHKYSRNSWVTCFRDNPNLFREETLLRVIDMVSTASISNEEPNIILLNLMRSCKETLRI